MTKRILLTAFALLLVVALTVPSFAWFIKTAKLTGADPNDLSASSKAAYFESGNGSQSSPYVISNEVHLYNLAWLQYIGYFNKGAVNNGLDQTYFVLKNDINAGGLVIPPIGTTEYPFIGNFDGNGKVISNINTANISTAFALKPTNAEFKSNSLLTKFSDKAATEVSNVMGFFGVVGSYSGEATASTVTTSVIAVKNFGLTGYTLTSSSAATTVGFVAGYVNAAVSNVLAGDCTLNTGNGVGGVTTLASGTVSEHTLIGYCETAYEETVNDSVFSIYDPKVSDTKTNINGAGTDSNWGGSIAMDDLFTGLDAARDAQNVMADYAYQAVKVMSADGQSFCGVERVVGDPWIFSDAVNKKNNYSVVFSGGNTAVTELMMLAGGAMVSTVVCHPAQDTNGNDIMATGRHIMFGGEYLNVEVSGGPPTVSLGTEENNATVWVIQNGSLFVLTGGCKLYVNAETASNNFSFSYLQKTTSGWFYDATYGLGYSPDNGTTNYYFALVNGEWGLYPNGQAVAYYIIRSENNYLVESDTLINPDYPAQSPYLTNNLETENENNTDITQWLTSTIDQGISIYVLKNGVKYYLANPYYDAQGIGHITLDSAASMLGWEFTETDSANSSGVIKNPYNAYLAYLGNGSWGFTENQSDAAKVIALEPAVDSRRWTFTDNISANDITFDTSKADTYNFEYGVANKYDASYIPLQEDGDHIPSNVNTGYITSGMYDQIKGGDPLSDIPQMNTGDVRATEFYTTNISSSVYNSDKELTSASVQALVWENGVASFKTISVPLSYTDGKPTAELTGDAASLAKYRDSVYDYYTLINSSDKRLYGLQFINGIINTNSLVTIPQAVINGVTYQDFEVPGDCIDFTLKQKGYITFYAGSYYPNTSCFFSLHHITRYKDGDTIPTGKKVNDIKTIKEISRIYESNGQYVYLYVNESASAPNDATLVFDTAWLTNPSGIVTNDLDVTSNSITSLFGEAYYFEIPVNAGEYALGSVKDKTGACLLYLDIGSTLQDAANQDVDSTIVYEMFEEEMQNHTYAKGVGLMDSAYETTASPNLSMTLAQSYGINITLDRTDTGTDSTVTVSSTASASATLNSKGGFTIAGSNVTLNDPTGTNTITTKQVTYWDKNITAGGTIIKTVIAWQDANGNSVVDDNEVAYETDGTWTTAPSTSGNTTTFQLSHHISSASINWTDEGVAENEKIWSNLTTTILAYQYAPVSGVTVTNSPVFTLETNADGTYTGKGSYAVTVSASGSTTVTKTENNAGADKTATSASVTAGTNVTVSSP